MLCFKCFQGFFLVSLFFLYLLRASFTNTTIKITYLITTHEVLGRMQNISLPAPNNFDESIS